MTFKNKTGGTLIVVMAVYVVAKCLLNMALSGHLSVATLVIAILEAAAFFLWYKYVNYVLAGLLAFIAIIYFPQNIANIGSNWIYLLEGAADVCCAALLCFHKDVAEHYTRPWNNNN